jgi:hypothetical protein
LCPLVCRLYELVLNLSSHKVHFDSPYTACLLGVSCLFYQFQGARGAWHHGIWHVEANSSSGSRLSKVLSLFLIIARRCVLPLQTPCCPAYFAYFVVLEMLGIMHSHWHSSSGYQMESHFLVHRTFRFKNTLLDLLTSCLHPSLGSSTSAAYKLRRA